MPTVKTTPCKKHIYKYSYTRANNIGFCCQCGLHKERKGTKEEWHELKQYRSKDSGGIHTVYHKFSDKFMEKPSFNRYIKTGYELMTAVAQWSKKYPNDVWFSSCEDGMFMTSLIVYIDHKTKDSYMGTTVVFIPQSGEQPNDMFLYPHALEEALHVLSNIKTTSKPIQKRQTSLRKKHWAVTLKWRP